MRYTPGRLGLVLFAVGLPGCASWDETRATIVTPVNALLHSRYPKALKAGDTGAVVAMFVPALREWSRTDTAALLARFSRIDRAQCVIHDAPPPDGTGAVHARCVLRLDGVAGGRRLTWTQPRATTVRPDPDGTWRITAMTPGTAEEVVSAVVFRDEAAARGLDATCRSRGITDRSGAVRKYICSGGVAVADLDDDGWEDVLLVGGSRLQLFRNREGRFTDVTASSGIATPATGECRCACFGDYDGDGDPDLFVGMLEHDNLLFENLGGLQFRPVPQARSGLLSSGHAASACFGDFDRDGDLDLFVANGESMYRNTPAPAHRAKNAHTNQYFRNGGDGTFTEHAAELGLGDTGWALACAAADYDKDGDLDLFVANDLGPDLLLRNRGDGNFDEVASDCGILHPGSSMSAEFGDVNGDGWPDLYVSGMASNSRWMLQQPGFPTPVPAVIDLLFRSRVLGIMREMFHGNRLYLNRGDGTFVESSAAAAANWLGWAWSAVLLDYDNDTHTDAYVANGFYTGELPDDC